MLGMTSARSAPPACGSPGRESSHSTTAVALRQQHAPLSSGGGRGSRGSGGEGGARARTSRWTARSRRCRARRRPGPRAQRRPRSRAGWRRGPWWPPRRRAGRGPPAAPPRAAHQPRANSSGTRPPRRPRRLRPPCSPWGCGGCTTSWDRHGPPRARERDRMLHAPLCAAGTAPKFSKPVDRNVRSSTS